MGVNDVTKPLPCTHILLLHVAYVECSEIDDGILSTQHQNSSHLGICICGGSRTLGTSEQDGGGLRTGSDEGVWKEGQMGGAKDHQVQR